MPVLTSLTLGLADLCLVHNCKSLLKHFSGNWGSDGGELSCAGSLCGLPRGVLSGVGWLPPSRSARSPVTQPSPRWPRARPPWEGPPSQTQTACIDMWMFPGLFTGLNCRTLAESPPTRGINHNSERNDNSLLNSRPLRVSVASWGRVMHSSSCTKCRIPWNRILV